MVYKRINDISNIVTEQKAVHLVWRQMAQNNSEKDVFRFSVPHHFAYFHKHHCRQTGML